MLVMITTDIAIVTSIAMLTSSTIFSTLIPTVILPVLTARRRISRAEGLRFHHDSLVS